jgi:hypothetical protein
MTTSEGTCYYANSLAEIHKDLELISGEWRAACTSWQRELCLDEDLLHTVLPLLKFVVDLVNILDPNTMRDHLQWVKVTFLNLL